MKLVTQIAQNDRKLLAAHEDKIQPRLPSRYVREPMDAVAVCRKFRVLDPGSDAPARVLDPGCGTGRLVRTLVTKSYYHRTSVVDYDLLPNAVRIVRERTTVERLEARTELHVADVLASSAEEAGGTDEIWVCGSPHQMKDVDAALDRVAGLLTDGDIAYVQTSAKDPDVGEQVDMTAMAKVGHRVFRGNELESLAEANGLELGEASHVDTACFCILTKKSTIEETGK